MSLLLADGQLAAASATILGAGSAERYVGITLSNIVATEQEIILTIARSGGTARQLCSAKLKENESLHVVGLPLDAGDILAGYASGGEAVDYVVMKSAGTQFNILSRQADGTPKQSAEITVETTEKYGLTRDGIAITGLLEQVRDLLLKIA